MAGAVYVAVNGWRGDGEPSLLDSVLTRAALGAPASVIGDGVADFNDFPNRTLSEIHDAYDEAVALTEAA
jgi:hypothetical protein